MRRDLLDIILLMGIFLYVGSFFFTDFDNDDIACVDCIVTADAVVGSGYVLCAKRNFVGAENDAPMIFCSTLTLLLTTRYLFGLVTVIIIIVNHHGSWCVGVIAVGCVSFFCV